MHGFLLDIIGNNPQIPLITQIQNCKDKNQRNLRHLRIDLESSAITDKVYCVHPRNPRSPRPNF
jgi:hypothetical protein